MTIQLPKSTMLGILYGESDDGKVVKDSICSHSRWSVIHNIIFEYKSHYYTAIYSVGATEYQDETPWEHDDTVDCTEVHQVEKVVKVWENI
jgi:hypothetical protein